MRFFLNGNRFAIGHLCHVRSTKQQASLPIGRTARVAYELDTLRAGCSKAAGLLLSKGGPDEDELEECAKLDDAIAHAQRILKSAVRDIMLSRLSRNSRSS
jgi:hypothetical protein